MSDEARERGMKVRREVLGDEHVDAAIERTRRGLLGTDPEGYAGCCEAIAELDLRAELDSIRAPTLVIAAADDPSAPPEQARLIADSIESARFTLLADARHMIAVERPEEVGRLLREHLLAEARA